MSVDTAPPAPPTLARPTATRLQGQRLPRRALPVAGAIGIGGGVILNVLTPVQGVAGTTVVAVLLFLIAYGGWSLSIEGRRHATDRLATTLIAATFIAAVVPLVSVLWTVVERGIAVLNLAFLTTSMRNVSSRSTGGGLYHALIGTMEQVALASLIAVPIGILTAIYLVEYGRGRSARVISFFVDVMVGVPSIVAGLFIFTGLVLTLGLPRSGLAAAFALAILMLPVVSRTTEEMLRVVPDDLREASYALGIPKWRTITKIVLPSASAGIITGAMLAVARITGETAPLLLTTFLTQSVNPNPLEGPQASIPTFIWDQLASGTTASLARAWGGALVLILFVTVLYSIARLVSWWFTGRRGVEAR